MLKPEDPEQVMKLRDGSLLNKTTILKSDHLPKCQKTRLSPKIEGAPNYRQAGPRLFDTTKLPVHGVAVPTTSGIRNVLRHIGAHNDSKKLQVLWICLRDELVVHINGRPFVLRDAEETFLSRPYEGINSVSLDQMETLLKQDILKEASFTRYGNEILVTDEQSDGQMVDRWEPVSNDSLKTLLEVYGELQSEGYLVRYERVPVTDEMSPKETDYDILIRKISQADIHSDIIFNCQTGRGLTTIGMVIAALIYFKRNGEPDNPFKIIPYKPRGKLTVDDVFETGQYPVVRCLIGVLEGGVEGKRKLDRAIDICASMQNLRVAIATYRNLILPQPDEKKREAAFSFFVQYMERYYFLVCFATYLDSEGAFLQSGSLSHVSFADWMHSRPDLYAILRRLLKEDTMGALRYVADEPATEISGRPYEMSVVTASRSGIVLRSKTLLKSDSSDACERTFLNSVEGAVNFREIRGFPVYGVGNPTLNGIQLAMEAIRRRRGSSKQICWYNLKEEPVIYINGFPFVVRDQKCPFTNPLQRIGHQKLEEMEACLKQEVLREAEVYNGAIFIVGESKEGEFFYRWEKVDIDSVQTSHEVYKSFENDGLRYERVPISDGKPPEISDFNTLASSISSATQDTALVFSSQMGRCRSITATVIAILVKLRITYGLPLKVLYFHRGYLVSEEDSFSDCDETKCRKQEKEQDDGDLEFEDIFQTGKLGKTLEDTRESLDAVIDRSSHLQNIREAIRQYLKLSTQQHVEPRVRSIALKRATQYLETYFRLMGFAAYLGSEFFGSGKSFKHWWDEERPGLQAAGQEELRTEKDSLPQLQIRGTDVEDRISNLSEDVLRQIMQFLSAKEGARLSVVSERFRNLITIRRSVEFVGTLENLTGFLSEVLALSVNGTRIQKFSLVCQEDIGPADYADIEKSLRHVLKLGVMDIELCICAESRYSLPQEIFTSKTLVKLKLGNCFLIGALPGSAWLPDLEIIILDSVRFYSLGSCGFRGLLSASPVLKELIIKRMDRETWEWSGVVSSKTLQRFSLRRVSPEYLYDGPNLQRITFDTPSLAYLDYADFVPQEYPTVNFLSLVEAKLNLQLVPNPLWNPSFPYDVDCFSSNPSNLIKALKNIDKLEITSGPPNVLGRFSRAIPRFENLHHVAMVLDAVECLPFLLCKTPNLETLVIKGKPSRKEELEIKMYLQKLPKCRIQFD